MEEAQRILEGRTTVSARKGDHLRRTLGSKLSYGKHVLPLRDDILRKLDTFHYKGLRQLLKVPSTYVDRAYTNAILLQQAEEACGKRITPVSQRLIERSIKELGVIYRLPRDDARRQATLTDESVANLPQTYRVGKPRIHWTLITMQRAWKMHDMHTRLKRRENTPIEFDRNCEEHQQILEAAAFNEEF